MDKQDHGDGYRPNVGIAVFNAKGQVLIGQRMNSANAWQMPQGGIDKGEDPWAAALRELREEIGTDKVAYLGEVDRWLRYDFPPHVLKDPTNSHGFRGQEQKWFAVRFTGEESDIDLTKNDQVEFSAWRWTSLAQAVKLIVPFKRAVYREMAQQFGRFVQPKE